MNLRTAYDPRDLSALVAAGDRINLRLRLESQVDDVWTATSLSGRTFIQRLVDDRGSEILRIAGVGGTDDGGDYIDFAIAGEETWALVPDGQLSIDLRHALQEVVSSSEYDTILWPTPFSVRRIFDQLPGPTGAGGSGAPLAELTVQQGAGSDVFILRSAGTVGPQGVKGDTGATGSAGVKGDPGAQGAQGIQGVPGTAGSAGAKGDTGAQGAQGIQGVAGPKGDAGGGVPTGGTTGQVLTKNSNTDYDDVWATPSGGSSDAVGTIRRATSNPWGASGLACDGSVYAKSSYSALATALGSIVDVASWTLRSSMAAASSTGLAPYPAWELNNFNAVCYVSGTGGASIWVAVGNLGIIYRSTDGGDTWAKISSGTSANLNAVACDGSGNLLAGGAGGGTILYSTNSGASWAANVSYGGGKDIGAIAYGNSTWVVLLGNAAAAAPTALQATTVSGTLSAAGTLGTATGANVTLIPAFLAYLNGTWIACGSRGSSTWNPSGSTGSIAYSTSLSGTWSTASTGLGQTIGSMAYFNSLFVAAANAGTSAASCATINGSYASASLGTSGAAGLLATDGTTLLALGVSSVADNGYAHATSANGTSWTSRHNTFFGSTLTTPSALAVGGGVWLAVGGAGGVGAGVIAKSTDALAWVNRSIGWIGAALAWACYGNGYNVFFGISGLLITTPDLATAWRIRTSGTINNFTRGYYLNSQFVALDGTTAIYQPGTTNDPTTTWAKVATAPIVFNALAWDSTNSVWIGVGAAGAIYTASTLTGTWTLRASGVFPGALVDVMFGNGITVAVGSAGAVYTTTPTSTWAVATGLPGGATGSNGPTRVVFGPNNTFFASNTTVQVSTDGNTWAPVKGLYGSSPNFLAAGPNSLLAGFGNAMLPAVTQDGVNFRDVRQAPFSLTTVFCLNGTYVGIAGPAEIISAPEYSYNTSTQFAVPNDTQRDAPFTKWIKAA